jgi:hypothetical protein
MPSHNPRREVLRLVLAAAILNYFGRQIIAVLKLVLEMEFGWSARDCGNIGGLAILGFTGWVLLIHRLLPRIEPVVLSRSPAVPI